MLVQGKLARDVRHALEESSRALLSLRPRADEAARPFPGGHAALALAHAALARALPDRGHAERCDRALARAIDAVCDSTPPPILFGGFVGVAWVAERLRGDPEAAVDPSEAIDAALLDLLESETWPHSYDLMRGLVGHGVYALERLPRPAARRILTRVIDHLSATAVRAPPGITWRSRAEWVAPPWRTPMSSGYDLGVAHGVPGVIALLARAWEAGVRKRACARLLDGAVAWLLAQELPRTSAGAFAAAVVDGTPQPPARAAWCYGDPGVAGALLTAARATGERAWRRAAVDIAARAAARDPASSGVADAGICHGAAGLAHVFARFHRETGDRRFAQAAREWLARTLALRRPNSGIAGWRSFDVSATALGGKPRWVRDASFLTGASGIVTVLASSLQDDEPAWDRLLLLS